MVKNYAEQMVEEILPTVLKNYESICKCEKCLNDIRCIALNNLKPLYYDSEKGGVYLKVKSLDLQYKTDVIREIANAIKIVSQNTNHNHEE